MTVAKAKRRARARRAVKMSGGHLHTIVAAGCHDIVKKEWLKRMKEDVFPLLDQLGVTK